MDPRNQRGPPVIKRLPTAHMNETSLGVQPRLPSTDNPVPLRIGDTFSLFDPEIGAFLCCDGIGDNRMMVTYADVPGTTPEGYTECLFEFTVPPDYGANKAYQKEVVKHGDAPPPVGSRKHKLLATLADNRDTEATNNLRREQQRCGDPVRFGDSVMLRHVKTKKYVTVLKSEVADVETECLKAVVTHNVSGFARFTIEPRYKMREVGDSVSTADQFFLKLSKRPLQGLHACGTPSDLLSCATSDHVLEVNSSLVATSWRVVPFATYEPDHADYLQCGTIVELYHSESDASLLCEDQQGTSLDITPARSEPMTPAAGAVADFASLRCGKGGGDTAHVEETRAQRTYLHQSGDDEVLNTNSLWLLEKSEGYFGVPSGGVARWGYRYRFRHLNSGMYLALKKKAAVAGATNDEAEVRLVENWTLDEGTFRDTEFSLEQKSSAHNRKFVHRHAVFYIGSADAAAPYYLMSRPESEAERAGGQEGDGVFGSHKLEEEHTFRMRSVQSSLRDDANTTASMMVHLEKFVDRASRGEWISRNDKRFMHKVLAQLIEFVIIPEPGADPDPLEMDGLPHKQRQRTLKEQSCIQLLFELLSVSHVKIVEAELLSPRGEVAAPAEAANGAASPALVETYVKDSYVSVEHLADTDWNMAHVFRLAYTLIKRILLENRENQLHAAQWPVVVEPFHTEHTLEKLKLPLHVTHS